MLNAEERYRLLEEVSELGERWEYGAVVNLLETLPLADLKLEPELGCSFAYALYHSAEVDKAFHLVRELENPCKARGRDRLYRRRLLIEGNVQVERGELLAGMEAYEEVLALATAAQDLRLIAAATMNMGTIAWLRCEYATALASHQRAIVAYQALHDDYRLASAHHNYAMVYKEMGLLKESSQHFDESRSLFTKCGGEKELAFNDYERALLMHMRGETATAEPFALRALQVVERLALHREQGEALRVLGMLRRDRGEYGMAEAELRHALQIARSARAKLLEAEVLEELAILFGETAREEIAEDHGRAAAELYFQMGTHVRAAKAASRVSDARQRALQ